MIPKYIYDIPSFMSKSDLESIYQLAYTLPSNSNILEIGCFLGSTTCTLKEARQDSNLYCVDKWTNEKHNDYLIGYDRKTVYENIESDKNIWRQNTNHLDNIFMYHEKSLDVEFDNDLKFDLIFLDGDHTYGNVIGELIKFSKLLKPNGILAGHDYGCAPCTKAITKFATDNDLAVWTLLDSVWYYKPYRTRQK